MKIANQRHLFDMPRDVAYLNCGYMSPMMHAVKQAGTLGLARKAQPWTIFAPDFFSGSDALREAFADLVGATGDDIAIIPAASYGISVAAMNLPLSAGQTVLAAVEQFPSNVYPWRERAAEVGARVVLLDRPADGNWARAVIEAMDKTTAIVALPHCHWTDGGYFDLEAIGSECRERGASLALDVTQSAGALPIDVKRVQPDFMAAATYKWLMGPYSMGLLYVSERWQKEGKHFEHNWIHRKNARNFARLVDYQDGFEPGARRFDVGERSNFALVPAAERGIRQLLEWGVDNISETISAMTEAIVEKTRSLGLRSVPRDQRAGHYLGLALPENAPSDLPAELAKRDVFVSVRGPSIRITPHLYNDDTDIDRLVQALGDVLKA